MSMIPPPPAFPAPPQVSPEEVAGRLASNDADILILDARPYSSFVLGHVLNALNVAPSMMLMRRLASGKISVADMLSEAQRPRFLSMMDRALIIVYDERAPPAPEGDNKIKIINALRTAGCQTALLTCLLSPFLAHPR